MRKFFCFDTNILYRYSISTKGNEKTGSLLWKISGNGLKQPSYILGVPYN